MEIGNIRKAIKDGKIEWKKHALGKMLERSISRSEVKSVILNGEVVENYPEDSPYPSVLIFSTIDERPLHTVVAYNGEEEMAYLITAYEPSLDVFEDDFKTRRTD